MNVEPIVMHYLTASEGLFVSPQFVIRGPDGTEWSCPDFVALCFPKRQVQIVEVTTASDISGLVEKVKNRHLQWIQYLKPDLIQRGAMSLTASIEPPDDRVNRATQRFAEGSNVC